MKEEFFQIILNAVEHKPYIATITKDNQEAQTIAQIYEGARGELRVSLQTGVGPLIGSDDSEATMTLPSHRNILPTRTGNTVPLYPSHGDQFSYEDNGYERVINGENIALANPVNAKTLTLWYQDIWAEVWHTNVDKQAITITHKDSAITEIPPHGTSDFFIKIEKPELAKPTIEWDIGDTHQGVIVRTDDETPVIGVTTAPADDREIAWDKYKTIVWVEQEDLSIRDIGFHVWHTDESEMDINEIKNIEQAIRHRLSFMNSTPCRAKVSNSMGADMVLL